MNAEQAREVVRRAGGLFSLTSAGKADLVPLAREQWRGHELAVWVPAERVTSDVRSAARMLVDNWLRAQWRGESGRAGRPGGRGELRR
jgi:hypothetical protein